ncbi:sugar transferase [Roseovarius indicus]|uniref:sugar transferase n=1 Tax=Roseovarius indicus TaxID=540747 RepID=UPI00351739EF
MTPSKRLMDLGLALILAVVLILPIAIIAVWILLRDGRPVFYPSERMKGVNQPFTLWKFRTMRSDRNDTGVSGGYKSARITRTGRALRGKRLDELPQLYNILKGDMSFVGPRPVVRLEMHKYGIHRPIYTSVKPGVTGLWQVSGRNDISYEERVQLDVDYVKSMTFMFDLGLMLKTVQVVVVPTGK